MMMRQVIVAVVALFGSAGALASPVPPALNSAAAMPAVDQTTQTEDVRFRNEQDDRMTVPVRLSASGPYRFLVDTGADHTAISRELAGRLGLAPGEAASVNTVAGVSMIATANLPDLELTRKPVRIRDAPVLDSANIGADGILGVDSLRSKRVQFDFETRTLSIVPSAVPDFRDEPGTIVVQGSRRNGRLVLTDATANGRRLTVVIDTGAQLSIGNEALREQLVGRGLMDQAQKIELEAVTGEKISGDYMFVRELEIGGVSIKDLAIVFADAHTFKKLKLDRRPALLLGMNAIRAFKKVSIDFANSKFRVVVPETSELDVRLASRI